VTFRAHVGPQAPGGTLSFSIDEAALDGCEAVPVSDSTAECTATGLTPGSHTIDVAYAGTDGYEASATALIHVVEGDDLPGEDPPEEGPGGSCNTGAAPTPGGLPASVHRLILRRRRRPRAVIPGC
jgi:hypothetical protein